MVRTAAAGVPLSLGQPQSLDEVPVGPKSTIFDSHNERELFQAIHGSWDPGYRLYPHLPFENLVELDPQALEPAELGFLHKTTVDYVLTTAEGRPLLAIEFDGLGHGCRRDGRYVQRVPARRDPQRAWKLGLKCRVADEAGLPLAVVSYEEKEIVDPEANLVVAHAIIGGFLAHEYASRRMQEFYEQEREYIESLPPDEQYEYVQDYIVISAEVEADMRMNPLAKRVSELERACWEAGLPISGHRQSWPDEEPRPPAADPTSDQFDPAALKSWLDGKKRIGSTVAVISLAGEIARTAWVRNIDMPGTTPLVLAGDIAHMLALRAALELARSCRPDRLT